MHVVVAGINMAYAVLSLDDNQFVLRPSYVLAGIFVLAGEYAFTRHGVHGTESVLRFEYVCVCGWVGACVVLGGTHRDPCPKSGGVGTGSDARAVFVFVFVHCWWRCCCAAVIVVVVVLDFAFLCRSVLLPLWRSCLPFHISCEL